MLTCIIRPIVDELNWKRRSIEVIAEGTKPLTSSPWTVQNQHIHSSIQFLELRLCIHFGLKFCGRKSTLDDCSKNTLLNLFITGWLFYQIVRDFLFKIADLHFPTPTKVSVAITLISFSIAWICCCFCQTPTDDHGFSRLCVGHGGPEAKPLFTFLQAHVWISQ